MPRAGKEQIREQDCDDRRASPRLPPDAFPDLKGACLVSGSAVRLINISRGGALLESTERLSPSTRISLRLITTNGVLQLYGQILRSTISHLNGGLRYRSAVAFEQEFPLQAVGVPASSRPRRTETGSPAPDKTELRFEGIVSKEARSDEDHLVTLIANLLQGEPDLSEFFRVNNW